MLIIGSTAMKYHGYEVMPKDLDIVMYPENIMKYIYDKRLTIRKITDTCISCNGETGQTEIFIAQSNNSWSDYLIEEGINRYDYKFLPKIASKEILLSIKAGHIHFPVGQRKFEKHIKYYDMLLKDLKEDKYKDTLTASHFKSTEDRIGKLKTPSLNRSEDKFFDNKVKCFFQHDDLHKVVAHFEKPLYEYMKGEGKVLCSEAKFNEFDPVRKLLCVLEEAMVIALERKIIPVLFGVEQKYCTADEAMKYALYRISTTLTGGWFRKFATDNYVELYNIYDRNYVITFLNDWQEGKIKQIQ